MTSSKITRSQLKKKAIIEAALTEFQNKGFQYASMDDIASHAGVSKRTVYNHFASKEILFEVIICEMMELFCLFDDIEYDINQPIKAQLRHLVEKEINLLESKSMALGAKVFIREALNNPSLVVSAMNRLDQLILPINKWFADACHAGVIKSDQPEFVTEQFLGVIKAFCFWPQVVQCKPFPDEGKKRRIINAVVDMIIKQYVL